MRYLLLSVLCLALGFQSTFSFASRPNFDQLVERYRQDLVFGDPDAAVEKIRNWKSTLRRDFTWPDIRYWNTQSNNFEPIISLSRAGYFARAYATPGHPFFKDKRIRRQAVGVVRHWLENDYQSYNWWMNRIGVQTNMMPTLFQFWDDFKASDRRKIRRILNRSSLKLGATGQNQVWYADITFARGLLFENERDLRDAVSEIEKTLRSNDGVGIQADGSFFQHGHTLYNGGYGQKYAQYVARYFSILSGTSFQFSDSSYDLLADLILDGSLWMMRGSAWDFGVTGREFTRPGFSSGYLKSACQELAGAAGPRRSEYQACFEQLSTGKPGTLNGSRMFYRGDLFAFHRPSYYASVRVHSSRTFNTDAPSNSEGLMSHNIADGTLWILKTGREYDGIYPVWDWTRIPGTTSHTRALDPAVYIPGVSAGENMRSRGRTKFAGGVSDGRTGAVGYDFRKANVDFSLSAKKAWFFFDEGVIALGNSVRCPDCERDVVTTVDQTILRGEAKEIGNALFHDGMATIPLDGTQLSHRVAAQTGTWYSINHQAPKTPVTHQVLTSWIDHGSRPSGGSYSYLILPNTDLNQLSQFQVEDHLEWINEPDLQAVWFKDTQTLQAVFYHEGTVRLGGVELSSDSAGVFLVKNGEIWAADPTQKRSGAMLDVTWENDRTENIKISYPRGNRAGASVKIVF